MFNTHPFSKASALGSVLFLLFSCGNSNESVTESQPNEVDSISVDLPEIAASPYLEKPYLISEGTLTGTVFRFAPDLDTSVCQSYGECDCCTEEILFIDNNRFISIAHCIADQTIQYGSYELVDSSLMIYYGPNRISKIYDEQMDEAGLGNKESRYIKEVEIGQKHQTELRAWSCGSSFFLAEKTGTDAYGTLAEDKTADKEVEFLKIDGTWDLIGW